MSDGLDEDIRMQFEHVGAIAADGADVAGFAAALGVREVFGGEQGGGAGRAEEYDVWFADVVLEQAVVFAVVGADDAEGQFFVRFAEVGPVVGGVDFLHEGLGAREGAVDDVDVVDLGATQEEG